MEDAERYQIETNSDFRPAMSNLTVWEDDQSDPVKNWLSSCRFASKCVPGFTLLYERLDGQVSLDRHTYEDDASI